MSSILSELSETFGLDIEFPFQIKIRGEAHTYTCLIKGYGAKEGMVIDEDWRKLEPVGEELLNLGYGYSCFVIDHPSTIEGFQEVLDDWGKTKK